MRVIFPGYGLAPADPSAPVRLARGAFKLGGRGAQDLVHALAFGKFVYELVEIANVLYDRFFDLFDTNTTICLQRDRLNVLNTGSSDKSLPGPTTQSRTRSRPDTSGTIQRVPASPKQTP